MYQHICDLQSQSMDPAASKNGIIKDATGGLISKSFQCPKRGNIKGEEHQCLICQTVFLKEEGLKRHIVKVHEKNQRQVTVPKPRKDRPKSSYSTSTNHKIREELNTKTLVPDVNPIEINSKIKTEVKLEIKEEPFDEFEAREQVCIEFITGKKFDNNQIASQTEDMPLVNKSKKFESNYDRCQSSWKISGKNQEIPEWFICLDCAPHKILQDSDQSMDKHFAENPEHYQINPAWFYLKFNLYVTDIARQSQIKCHQESSEQVKCLRCNNSFSRQSDLKEHYSSVHEKDKLLQCLLSRNEAKHTKKRPMNESNFEKHQKNLQYIDSASNELDLLRMSPDLKPRHKDTASKQSLLVSDKDLDDILTVEIEPTGQMVANVDSYDMDSSSEISSLEQKEHRYQRMRQLNNTASKRCRINHERKFETHEDNQILLTAKNMELKGKVADLETQVAKFKTTISNMVLKRTTKHDAFLQESGKKRHMETVH